MSVRPVLAEEPLVNLLTETDPGLVGLRRLFALNVLQQIGAGRLRRMLSPALAEVILDVTRLGGLETAPDWSLSDDARERLTEVRELLSSIAFGGRGARATGVLVPGNEGGWQTFSVSVVDTPAQWPRRLVVDIDHALHRIDGPAAHVREVVKDCAPEAAGLVLVRSRFEADLTESVSAVRYALEVAIGVASRRSGGRMPRVAIVRNVERAADFEELPFDVRLALVHEAAELPLAEDGWHVFDADDMSRAMQHWHNGERVCLRVRCPEDAIEALLGFEWPNRRRRVADAPVRHAEVA